MDSLNKIWIIFFIVFFNMTTLKSQIIVNDDTLLFSNIVKYIKNNDKIFLTDLGVNLKRKKVNWVFDSTQTVIKKFKGARPSLDSIVLTNKIKDDFFLNFKFCRKCLGINCQMVFIEKNIFLLSFFTFNNEREFKFNMCCGLGKNEVSYLVEYKSSSFSIIQKRAIVSF
jgi:hypothetical protein